VDRAKERYVEERATILVTLERFRRPRPEREIHPMRFHVLSAILAAATFVPARQALQVSGGPDSDRKVSTVFVSTTDGPVLAGASVSYGRAEWRDSYEGMLEQLREGPYTRLGKGWWTTFDTVGALEIGGTKIDAGSYYLGLAVDKDGAFRLLLFDSKQAMKSGLLPFTTALYRGDAKAEFTAPLTFAKNSLKEAAARMEIEITADKNDPATGRLSIRWGRHEASAPVKFHIAGAKDATPPKK
jgi:hypothetical protein